jgi:hypothetical protein
MALKTQFVEVRGKTGVVYFLFVKMHKKVDHIGVGRCILSSAFHYCL